MKEFKTIEISNPRFENDFLRYITVKSENLKGRGDICVFSPPGIEEYEILPAGNLTSWCIWKFVELDIKRRCSSFST